MLLYILDLSVGVNAWMFELDQLRGKKTFMYLCLLDQLKHFFFSRMHPPSCRKLTLICQYDLE